MIFLINSKTVTHNDIQSLPLVIKYTITLLLKEKFGYEIKDIMIIFDRTRDSLQKWLSKIIF